MEEIRLVKAETKEQYDKIKWLYRRSFARLERMPYFILRSKIKSGQMEMYAIVDEKDEFLGFGCYVVHEDIAMGQYLAIMPEYQGMGIGSKALPQIIATMGDRRLVFEIESTLVDAPDIETRRRRKAFYEKNGMKPMGYSVVYFGQNMEIMAHNDKVSYEEYIGTYRAVLGYIFSAFIHLI